MDAHLNAATCSGITSLRESDVRLLGELRNRLPLIVFKRLLFALLFRLK